MDLNQWLTLNALGTFASALVVLRFVVEYTKGGVDALASKVGVSIPTRLYAYLVALAMLLPYKHFMGALTAETVYLDMLNGFVLAAAAGFMEKPKVTLQDAAAALGLSLAGGEAEQEQPAKELIGFHVGQAPEDDYDDDENDSTI